VLLGATECEAEAGLDLVENEHAFVLVGHSPDTVELAGPGTIPLNRLDCDTRDLAPIAVQQILFIVQRTESTAVTIRQEDEVPGMIQGKGLNLDLLIGFPVGSTMSVLIKCRTGSGGRQR
jgi:hypothetical protein